MTRSRHADFDDSAELFESTFSPAIDGDEDDEEDEDEDEDDD